MKVCFATHNEHKLREVRRMLGSSFELLSLADIGCFESIPENQQTLQGNADEKASYVFERFGVPVFADDTGLEIEALNGAPGVYSARYAGLDRNIHRNIQKVLSELGNTPHRAAQFRTVITYMDGKSTHRFEGKVAGDIIHERRGKNGFGYDPIFVPEGYKHTFAELSAEEKNRISHRARAIEGLVGFLRRIN